MTVRIRRKGQPDFVTILEKTPDGMVKRIEKTKPSKKKTTGQQTKPKPPEISLNQPGRLRVAHLLSLFSVSRTTLYNGISSGRYPEPDGKDGRMPYWNTETIRRWLEGNPVDRK